MPKDDKKTRPCTCAFSQQLRCIRFKEGVCNEKPIPGTFGARRPAPVRKKRSRREIGGMDRPR